MAQHNIPEGGEDSALELVMYTVSALIADGSVTVFYHLRRVLDRVHLDWKARLQ